VCTALVILLNYELTIFGTKPVSYTGTISYSLYLWHWPVLVFALRCGLLDSTLSIITLLLCIYLISVLSYSFTEKRQFKIRTVVILYLVLLCAYAFFKKTDGHNYISSYIRDNGSWSQNTVVPREQNLTMSIFSDDKTMPVYHYGRQDVKPDVFIIGDSHADHYSFYFRNVNTYPVYMSALHATMAYGPVFDSMKKARLTGPELRHKYYQTYRKMLATLDRGSKVILANRWDVGYEQYIFEYDLEDNTDNFKNYLKVLLDDISSCTSLYKDLEFYIVGQGVITSSVVVNCLKTDLKGSVLSYIIDASACANTPDYQGERLELINSALREFARRNDNVHFIDRNIPQSLGNRLYRTFTPDDNPLYYDDNHYTNAGGIFIGSYIMECVADKKY
ncbi:MAG: acyltransferase family protein, partial [Succinivibrio sp.]